MRKSAHFFSALDILLKISYNMLYDFEGGGSVNIGGVEIASGLALAPMAGVTDVAFRGVCREMGAAYTVTEMVSSMALMHQDRKSLKIMELGPGEHPAAVQLFGSDPVCMGEAAAKACELSGCDVLDINMGCPMGKITGAGDGSALMRTPELARKIIESVVKSVRRPVTVKFRKGWDRGHVNCVEFAGMCQSAGAAAVTVHGRTREQMYSGAADWDAIRAVREAVTIPLFANGDVFTAQDAVRILKYTGADGVMIGRGAQGDPWLFAQTRAALEGREIPAPPPYSLRIETAVRQIRTSSAYLGEKIACLEARKHLAWYLHGMPRASFFRNQIMSVETLADIEAVARDVLDFLRDEERRDERDG